MCAKNLRIQLEQSRVRGIADVVFVIDNSCSMFGIIDGVRNHVGDLAREATSGQFSVDLRLGMVMHSPVKEFAFCSDIVTFQGYLSNLDGKGGNETTLPALDRALDFPWRTPGIRFIILFTDEPVRGGGRAEEQLRYLPELSEKVMKLGVHVILVGPKCKALDELGAIDKVVRVEKSKAELVEHGKFQSFMIEIGRTVTIASPTDAPSEYRKNLYAGF